MDDPLSTSVRELAQALVSGEVSAREVVEAHLARLDATAQLRAVVTRCDDRALTEADRADERRRRGHALGALHAVPFTIKDAIATAEVATSAGSPGLVGNVPSADATVVRRVREAGAILLGKSNTAELTLRYETDNEIIGQTWNPHGDGLSPGGSSGGAAVAVATGAAAFDLGTDTGGSVRLPAHFCGVVGLKPTAGRVPLTGLVAGGTPIDFLTQIGPLARTVGDARLLLEVITGVDGTDPLAVPMASRVRRPELTGTRVGVIADNGAAAPTPAVAAAVSGSASELEEAGAVIEPADPAPLTAAGSIFVRFFTADGGEWLRRLTRRLGAPQSSIAPPPLETPPPASEWSELVEDWLAFRRGMSGLLRDHDLLLLPVHPEPAQPPGELERPNRLHGYSYTVAFNLVGWPAISVPAGEDERGLPVGAQLVARPGQEELLLAAAEVIEAARPGWRATA